MVNQIKAMGSSLDWSREQFTMSERLSRAVRKAFHILYEKNKIYHDSYLINRCPRCQTVLSDIETVYKETDTKLYYLKYFLSDDNGKARDEFLTVATVRPETIF
ncbi:MAG: class I tRNA ligase family protein [bacterium]|nr:class I tRNA ligase family protein [bacterium]